MGEKHILRGELIYTFNYLGFTPLLGDALWNSVRALGTDLGASGCSSERCWFVFFSSSIMMILDLYPVNLWPAVVSLSLSTKEGNNVGRSWGGRGVVDVCMGLATKFLQIPWDWEVTTTRAHFLVLSNCAFLCVCVCVAQPEPLDCARMWCGSKMSSALTSVEVHSSRNWAMPGGKRGRNNTHTHTQNSLINVIMINSDCMKCIKQHDPPQIYTLRFWAWWYLLLST